MASDGEQQEQQREQTFAEAVLGKETFSARWMQRWVALPDSARVVTATAFFVWVREVVERLSSTREVCVHPASSSEPPIATMDQNRPSRPAMAPPTRTRPVGPDKRGNAPFRAMYLGGRPEPRSAGGCSCARPIGALRTG